MKFNLAEKADNCKFFVLNGKVFVKSAHQRIYQIYRVPGLDALAISSWKKYVSWAKVFFFFLSSSFTKRDVSWELFVQVLSDKLWHYIIYAA
jgi:hypothetical protein